MIERLRGAIAEKDIAARHVVVMAGDVGYGLDVTGQTLEQLPREGEAAELYVFTHVREGAIQLFGFATRVERSVFELLLGVNGVGPGTALSALTQLSPATLARAIEQGDADSIAKAKGIGKKTAERIVLDLKGKLGAIALESAVSSRREGPATGADLGPVARDALQALIGLGMREPIARRAVDEALKSMEPDPEVQDLIREALRKKSARA